MPNCRSGYAPVGSRSKASSFSVKASSSIRHKVSFFGFPSDSVLKDKWIRKIQRHDIDKNGKVSSYKPTNSSKVCSLHFYESDFVKDSRDSNATRKRKRQEFQLQKLQLLPNAYPRKFPNCPQYMSIPETTLRTSPCTSQKRLLNENQRMSEMAESLLSSDTFTSYDDLCKLLKSRDYVFPTDCHFIISKESVLFVFIPEALLKEKPSAPILSASIRIRLNLSVEVYLKSVQLTSSTFDHVLQKSGCVSSLDEISNLLACVKSLCDSGCTSDFLNCIQAAQDILRRYLTATIERQQQQQQHNEDYQTRGLVQFVCEQLRLCQLPVNGRTYSKELLMESFLWFMTSHSAYVKLKDLLILPSVRRLQQLSSGTSVAPSEVDMQYLECRRKNVSDHEKLVIMLIDEVYTASRVEFVNGQMVGLTQDGKLSKTVLTFMIQAVNGKYKDVVKLVPVEKLNVDILQDNFKHAMMEVSKLFHVIGVSVDNHAVNR